MTDISTTRVASSRLDSTDYSTLAFGNVFTDHMFRMDYRDGAWRDAKILPYGPFSIEPGALALHYGQSVFEGLKAFAGDDGKIRIFRPDQNFNRLNTSCQRLCIPEIDKQTFLSALDALVDIDRAWIPANRGQALYLRPLVFGTEPNLTVKPSDEYTFFIMASPVREYFDKSKPTISLKAEPAYTRAAPGGMGFAKTAGNYAASLLPGVERKDEGYDQVLWLDGVSHEYVEEVGQMNIFFKIAGKVITPALKGTILPGVTRNCVIELLREKGIPCEERRIRIHELVEAAYAGTLEEAFGAGTAAVVAPVGMIEAEGQQIEINQRQPGELSRFLYNEILDIQNGISPDRFGWNHIVERAAP